MSKVQAASTDSRAFLRELIGALVLGAIVGQVAGLLFEAAIWIART